MKNKKNCWEIYWILWEFTWRWDHQQQMASFLTYLIVGSSGKYDLLLLLFFLSWFCWSFNRELWRIIDTMCKMKIISFFLCRNCSDKRVRSLHGINWILFCSVADWMGSPFERVVCGDFNGKLLNSLKIEKNEKPWHCIYKIIL